MRSINRTTWVMASIMMVLAACAVWPTGARAGPTDVTTLSANAYLISQSTTIIGSGDAATNTIMATSGGSLDPGAIATQGIGTVCDTYLDTGPASTMGTNPPPLLGLTEEHYMFNYTSGASTLVPAASADINPCANTARGNAYANWAKIANPRA